MSSSDEPGIAPNAQRLLWAGFMAILAAGVGFSIRGGILGDWGKQFGFTQGDLGSITGGGLTGFGIIILIGALLADKLGYGTLMCLAFVAHLSSAVLTLAATPIFNSLGGLESEGAKAAASPVYFGECFCLPLATALQRQSSIRWLRRYFPRARRIPEHFARGLAGRTYLGGLLSYFLVGKVSWEIQMGMFLIPTMLYGAMLLGQKFPKSEASQRALLTATCSNRSACWCRHHLSAVGAVFCSARLRFQNAAIGWGLAALLFVVFGFVTQWTLGPVLLAFLLLIHALVGYVELGTDSWIANITGNIMASPQKGLLLFVYTSGLMFVLRFFAGPIVHRFRRWDCCLSVR